MLLIVVAVLVAVGGFATYYQTTYGEAKTGHLTCQQQLTACTGQLASTNTSLSETSQDVSQIAELYENQSAAVGDLGAKLAAMTAERNQYKKESEDKGFQITKLSVQVTDLSNKIVALEDENKDLRADLDQCEEDLDACEETA